MDTAYGCPVLGNLAVVDNTHACVLDPSLVLIKIVGLQQDHVAAIAAAALQKTTCGGAGLLGCNNLQQLITNGVKTMPQPKMGKPRIAITDLQTKLVTDALLRRAQLRGH